MTTTRQPSDVGVPADGMNDMAEVSLDKLKELEEAGEREPDDEEAELAELVEEPELDPDEHEVGLDELLALQFATTDDHDAPAGDGPAGDAAGSGDPLLVPSASAHEFVCRSCFLIKDRRQMADTGRRVCRDCVASG